jgi:hypothetical protein
MCNIEDFKFLADMIQHVPLPLRARYVFCCAPINRKMPFVCTMFLKVGVNLELTISTICNFLYMNEYNFFNSMLDNIVKINQSLLIGYASILDGLSLFQKLLLI